MEEFGKFLGWVTVVCFGLSVLNYVVKKLNFVLRKKLDKEAPVLVMYTKLMKLIIRYRGRSICSAASVPAAVSRKNIADRAYCGYADDSDGIVRNHIEEDRCRCA